MDKEEQRKEKEISPHTPYIEKEIKKEEDIYISCVRARARDPKQALSKADIRLLRQSGSIIPEDRNLLDRYIRDIPTLERVIAHAKLQGFEDEAFIRSWYDEMDSTLWYDRKGVECRNWACVLKNYWNNRQYYAHFRDPDRLPDARKRQFNNHTPDNTDAMTPQRLREIEIAEKYLNGGAV